MSNDRLPVLKMIQAGQKLDKTAIDETILALRDGLSEGDDKPVLIDVQDDADGEQVLIHSD